MLTTAVVGLLGVVLRITSTMEGLCGAEEDERVAGAWYVGKEVWVVEGVDVVETKVGGDTEGLG